MIKDINVNFSADGSKWYTLEGEDGSYIYPSVTTMIDETQKQSYHLTRWMIDKGWNESYKIKEQAAALGTAFHDIVRMFLCTTDIRKLQDIIDICANTLPTDYTNVSFSDSEVEQFRFKLIKYILCFLRYYIFEIQRIYEVLACELPVYCHKYKFCGTADLLLASKEEPDKLCTIVDFKTGNPDKTKLSYQLSFYSEAVKEMSKSNSLPFICRDNIHLIGFYPKDFRGNIATYSKEYVPKIDTSVLSSISTLYHSRNEFSPRPGRWVQKINSVAGDKDIKYLSIEDIDDIISKSKSSI